MEQVRINDSFQWDVPELAELIPKYLKGVGEVEILAEDELFVTVKIDFFKPIRVKHWDYLTRNGLMVDSNTNKVLGSAMFNVYLEEIPFNGDESVVLYFGVQTAPTTKPVPLSERNVTFFLEVLAIYLENGVWMYDYFS